MISDPTQRAFPWLLPAHEPPWKAYAQSRRGEMLIAVDMLVAGDLRRDVIAFLKQRLEASREGPAGALGATYPIGGVAPYQSEAPASREGLLASPATVEPRASPSYPIRGVTPHRCEFEAYSDGFFCAVCGHPR